MKYLKHYYLPYGGKKGTLNLNMWCDMFYRREKRIIEILPIPSL